MKDPCHGSRCLCARTRRGGADPGCAPCRAQSGAARGACVPEHGVEGRTPAAHRAEAHCDTDPSVNDGSRDRGRRPDRNVKTHLDGPRSEKKDCPSDRPGTRVPNRRKDTGQMATDTANDRSEVYGCPIPNPSHSPYLELHVLGYNSGSLTATGTVRRVRSIRRCFRAYFGHQTVGSQRLQAYILRIIE